MDWEPFPMTSKIPWPDRSNAFGRSYFSLLADASIAMLVYCTVMQLAVLKEFTSALREVSWGFSDEEAAPGSKAAHQLETSPAKRITLLFASVVLLLHNLVVKSLAASAAYTERAVTFWEGYQNLSLISQHDTHEMKWMPNLRNMKMA